MFVCRSSLVLNPWNLVESSRQVIFSIHKPSHSATQCSLSWLQPLEASCHALLTV
ncbi:hypothetical protein HanRHA438_Chr08g0348521 [Helianthus annuus]|nr:hypothetical protein HanRHA438_Chr08g0348521 [Helianthus annuus]